jgi:predicted outer membrane protein
MNRDSLVPWLCAAALFASPLTAQEIGVRAGQADVQVDGANVDVDVRRQDPNTPILNRPRTQNPAAVSNAEIAQWVLIDQRNMVALSEYAVQRTQSRDVRNLAEQIINDHQSLIQTLDRFATARPQVRAQRQDQGADEPTEERRRVRDTTRRPLERLADRIDERVEERAEGGGPRIAQGRGLLARGPSPWIEIHQEISNQLAEKARKDLEQRQGREFEGAFLGMIVAAHLNEEATLSVLSQRAEGDLKNALENALESAREHREEAEKVMDKVR